MNKLIKTLVLACVPLMFSATTVLAEDYQEGVHYQVLSSAIDNNSGSIVVNEFFGYTCPHCNAFHPSLEHWADQQNDDVVFTPVPVVFSKAWEPYAKAYYISKIVGVYDKSHDAIYNAVHIDKRRLATREALQKFFASFNVSEDDFNKAYDSFALKNLLRQGKRLAGKARITGVPSMLVNGKYLVTTSMAGSHENVLKVVDYLIDKERG